MDLAIGCRAAQNDESGRDANFVVRGNLQRGGGDASGELRRKDHHGCWLARLERQPRTQPPSGERERGYGENQSAHITLLVIATSTHSIASARSSFTLFHVPVIMT